VSPGDTFAEHATRLQRIAATAFALGGARDASAEVIFDNSTGTSSSGGYVVGEYSPGSVYALGGNFTVPIGAPPHLVGGSIGVSFGASSSGRNEMDPEIAENVGGADPGGDPGECDDQRPADGSYIRDFTVSPEALLTPGALASPPSAGRRYDARDALRAGRTSGATIARERHSAPWRLANRSAAAPIDQYGW
jgi:hypothetical protein